MQDDMQQQIASDLGIAELPPEEQRELIAQFGAVAMQASIYAILEAVPEGKRDEFKKLTEAQDQAGVQAFLEREVPDHETLAKQAVASEIQKFKDFQKTLG
ncbi:MAG: hypothetical protein KGI41_02465 [Patescibacteria group bacterium]|nr:hypothetical protein [Patescibacteria group bacterium]MDE1966078.1 hypothetical protein [Patescibacteria group bacterium]